MLLIFIVILVLLTSTFLDDQLRPDSNSLSPLFSQVLINVPNFQLQPGDILVDIKSTLGFGHASIFVKPGWVSDCLRLGCFNRLTTFGPCQQSNDVYVIRLPINNPLLPDPTRTDVIECMLELTKNVDLASEHDVKFASIAHMVGVVTQSCFQPIDKHTIQQLADFPEKRYFCSEYVLLIVQKAFQLVYKDTNHPFIQFKASKCRPNKLTELNHLGWQVFKFPSYCRFRKNSLMNQPAL